MNEDSKKVALLGAGYIADFHLQALRHVRGAQLVGVCDLSRTRAERLAAQVEGAQAFTDLDQMLQATRPQVVHVLTPPPAHFPAITQLLGAGVAVLAEKPLAIRSQDCAALAGLAQERNLALGTGYNFLFSTAYQRLMDDLAAGLLGRLDQVDVVWNKPLPQVHFGPFGGWLFADPRNVLFEVGPHSFAHVSHLVGETEWTAVEARDPVRLPNDLVFHRLWELQGRRDRVGVRVRLSFIDGYPEQYLHVRGSAASAMVDLELNTYVLRQHSQDLPDFDRFATSVRGAGQAVAQAGATLGSFVLSKVGLPALGGPYQASITRAVRTFYAGLTPGAAGHPLNLDARLAPALAEHSVKLAELAASAAHLAPAPQSRRISVPEAGAANGASNGEGNGEGKNGAHNGAHNGAGNGTHPAPTVLVLGGTGFIGRALCKRLSQEGLGVRALVRDTRGHAEELTAMGVELARGDFTDISSVEAALSGVKDLYHLARGQGRTWDDYQRLDVEPTRRIAELCLAREVALHYTSSIAIYGGGKPGDMVTEETPPGKGAVRVNLYARAKAEIEKMLLQMHKERGLKVIIYRPGIVIGAGGSPYHWGVAAWPYSDICHPWGEGRGPLPFVLVDDCADALVRALKVPGLWGETFNLVGEPCLSGVDYLDELERLAGMKVRRLPIKPWRRFAEDVAKYAMKTVARTERNLPSYQYYAGLAGHGPYSPEKAKRKLGWRPSGERSQLVQQGIAVPVADFLS